MYRGTGTSCSSSGPWGTPHSVLPLHLDNPARTSGLSYELARSRASFLWTQWRSSAPRSNEKRPRRQMDMADASNDTASKSAAPEQPDAPSSLVEPASGVPRSGEVLRERAAVSVAPLRQ